MMVILSEGEGSFCSATMQFILKRDRQGLFHVASIQSKAGRRLLRDRGVGESDLDTMCLLEDEHLFKRSTAALRVGTRAPREGQPDRPRALGALRPAGLVLRSGGPQSVLAAGQEKLSAPHRGTVDEGL